MKPKLRVLFVIRATETYFYFRSIIESFYTRGHFVKILFDKDCSRKSLEYLNDIKREEFTYDWAVHSSSKFRNILLYSRFLLSLRRYYKVSGQSSFYRKRWSNALPSRLTKILQLSLFRALLVNDFAAAIYKYLEKVFPLDKLIMQELREFSPDIVLATPANLETSCDIDYLKTAQELKIPTAIPVISWDNLTTKGLIHIKPDLLLTWNRAQVKEAKEHHGINENETRVVGSTLFDSWFSKFSHSQTKVDFYKKHGLKEDKRIILYFGSSLSISGDERWLIRKIAKIISSEFQLVVRPHPDNSSSYKDFSGKNIKVIPQGGAYPDKPEARQLLYETVSFATICVGVNTSGLIDSVILDKPSVSILSNKYSQTQIETQHFRHLVDSDAIEILDTPKELMQFAAEVLRGVDKHKKQRKDFVKNFIRPRGLNVSAGEIMVKEIEQLGGYSRGEVNENSSHWRKWLNR